MPNKSDNLFFCLSTNKQYYTKKVSVIFCPTTNKIMGALFFVFAHLSFSQPRLTLPRHDEIYVVFAYQKSV